MMVRRTVELKLLEEQYSGANNNLIILYGRKGIGKTTLLHEFLEGKPSVYYYEGSECVDKLQLFLMNREASVTSDPKEILNYPNLFSEIIDRHSEKTIIVLDEFHYIIKNSPAFLETFQLLANTNHPVMFVLSSSSVRWIENDMITELGDIARFITAYMKLKEFSFVDLVNRFPKSSVETCIYIKAILGGVPDYLDEWQESKSVSENIKQILLNKNNRLFYEVQNFLKLELREPAVYNTILSALAEGNRKLNDLHAITEFSRAKILVYLKHLIQLDIVEKITPLNEEGKENVQKGLYRIKDNFLSFWYRFVFANLSDLMLNKTDKVFEERIKPYLNEYMGEYFADVCTEFLKLMNQHDRLPVKLIWWDRWYGKSGTIDILAQSNEGKTLAGICIWEDRKAQISDYELLLTLIKEAGKDPDYCYLFSKEGFMEELYQHTAGSRNTSFISLEDL